MALEVRFFDDREYLYVQSLLLALINNHLFRIGMKRLFYSNCSLLFFVISFTKEKLSKTNEDLELLLV